MTDCAKTIGITPAALMRRGMKLRDASRCRPRVMVRCGIWIATRRAAITIADHDRDDDQQRKGAERAGAHELEGLENPRPDPLKDREEDHEAGAVADAAL